jgi:outer membrane protein assembly factor BamB
MWGRLLACGGLAIRLPAVDTILMQRASWFPSHRAGGLTIRRSLLFLLPLLLSAADEWPQFRGNPQLTGVATTELPATIKLLWTYEAGDAIESSAAISAGTVYVGVETGDLLAIDLATGKLRWKYRAQEGIAESSPAVHEGVVYVGDSAGLLHAVRAADGKALWTFKTEAEIKSSPVVFGDRVLIGSYDGNIYCLSARDGKLIWKYTTSNFVHATPAIEGGVLYLGGCDEVFRGVRLTDGQEVLQFPAGGYTGASPVLVAKRAYYGTFSNDVVAADLATKRILWHYENRARSFPFYSSAAAVGDRIVLGGRDKLVYCLNARTGKPIWTFPARARVDSSPAIASGRVYIGSNDGHFYVLDLAAGKKLWDFTAGAPLSASPAVAEGRVVIGSQDGRLYCFGQANP